MPQRVQLSADLARSCAQQEPPRVEHCRAVGHREHLFQPVLGHDDRYAQLQIDFAHRIEKIACGDRVELTRRLVQYKRLRLHGHNGRKI